MHNLKMFVGWCLMKIRTTKPESGNKFYNTVSKGGYSHCIVGYPTDKGCNVLANCVGYACGRFNEIIGTIGDLNTITKTIINGITSIVYSFTGLVFPFFKDSITDKRLFNTVKQIIIKIMNK